MTSPSLKEKTAKGLLWAAISNGGQQVLNLVFGIFLGRLLTAEDYGPVGMLAIFALIAASLQESGFISALNRKADARQEDYNAVFWFNILCGLVVYAVLFMCAPMIAWWFREPVLVPLSRLSFLSFVISSWGIAPRAYLFRNLRVKDTTKITFAALLCSGVTGITLAWNGFTYWGIAVQNLVFCACITVGSWCLSGWRPSLRIDLRPLRGMFGFSSKLLVTNIFTHVSNNLFSVFFGRLYGSRAVGYYNQANKWTTIGHSTITGMLWNVIQPVFARLEDDPARKQRAFRKMLRFTMFVSCPALFGLALIAPEFITIAITERWLPSAELMQWLCIGGAFIPAGSLYSNFLVSQGRSNIFMYNSIALCLLQTGSLFVLYPYGIRPMVGAYVAINILWVPVWNRCAHRHIHLPLLTALRDMLPFVLIAAAAMGVAYAASCLWINIYAVLATKVAVAAAVYLGTLKLLHAAVLEESISYLRRKPVRE